MGEKERKGQKNDTIQRMTYVRGTSITIRGIFSRPANTTPLCSGLKTNRHQPGREIKRPEEMIRNPQKEEAAQTPIEITTQKKKRIVFQHQRHLGTIRTHGS